jgi:hypothetical protein
VQLEGFDALLEDKERDDREGQDPVAGERFGVAAVAAQEIEVLESATETLKEGDGQPGSGAVYNRDRMILHGR